MVGQSTRSVVASSLNVRTGFSNPHDYSSKQSLLLIVCFSTHLYCPVTFQGCTPYNRASLLPAMYYMKLISKTPTVKR